MLVDLPPHVKRSVLQVFAYGMPKTKVVPAERASAYLMIAFRKKLNTINTQYILND